MPVDRSRRDVLHVRISVFQLSAVKEAIQSGYVKIGGVNRDPEKRAASELRYFLKNRDKIRAHRRQHAMEVRKAHGVQPRPKRPETVEDLEFKGEWPRVKLTLTPDDIYAGKGVSAFSRNGYGLALGTGSHLSL